MSKQYLNLVENTNYRLLIKELKESINSIIKSKITEDVKDAIISIKNKEKLGKIRDALLKNVDNDSPDNIFNLLTVLKNKVENVTGEEKIKIENLIKILTKLYEKITLGKNGDAESLAISLKKQKGFRGKIVGIN